MHSPAGPFKVSQEAALRASSALAVIMSAPSPQPVSRIYTEVPINAAMPYIVLGDDQVLLENYICANQAEIYSTVHLWSMTSPLDKGAQARAMGSEIIGILNQALALDGWVIDEWELESERYVTDPDGSTHGFIAFHYQLTQLVD